MELLALCIAIVALLLSCLSWCQTRRNRDRGKVGEDSETPGAEQRASKDLAATLRADHVGNLRMIRELQSRVAELRQETLEEIRDNLRHLARKLDRLAGRAVRELKDLKDGLDVTLLQVQVGLRLTVDDAQAHLKVIEAKRELILARRALARNDLSEAELRTEAALRNLEEAQSLALGFHQNIAALQNQTEELLVAIRGKASSLRAATDALLEGTDRLLTEMKGGSTAARSAA
jgi:hypothetical protein